MIEISENGYDIYLLLYVSSFSVFIFGGFCLCGWLVGLFVLISRHLWLHSVQIKMNNPLLHASQPRKKRYLPFHNMIFYTIFMKSFDCSSTLSCFVKQTILFCSIWRFQLNLVLIAWRKRAVLALITLKLVPVACIF